MDSDVSAYDIEGFACAYASYGLNEIPDANFSNLFVYFKDVENDKGELFVNGESVADDVSVDGMLYNPGKKAIMFFTDAEEGAGTLNMYNGKKLYILDKLSSLRGMGIWAHRLNFTTENPIEVDAVLGQYLGRGDFDPGTCTRGLYARGVE